MFRQACSRISTKVYGVRCDTPITGNQSPCSLGTGFMIAPNVIITAAHLIHQDNDVTKPRHSMFRVIRAPDIGQQLETAQLIAEETVRDLALLRLENARSTLSVTLHRAILPQGTSCGSIGFPLATVDQRGFNLTLRFQGANISSYANYQDPSGRTLNYYETDSLIYNGSSGCPGFDRDSTVFGLHCKVLLDPTVKQQQGVTPTQSDRLAISLWVPSIDIISFAHSNGVTT